MDACEVRKGDTDEKIKKLLTHLGDLENYVNADIAITNIKRAMLIQINCKSCFHKALEREKSTICPRLGVYPYLQSILHGPLLRSVLPHDKV